MHRQEMLQTRIPALENIYEVKIKIKGAVQNNDVLNRTMMYKTEQWCIKQNNDVSNRNVKKNISSIETNIEKNYRTKLTF